MLSGLFALWFFVVMAFVLVPAAFWIYALVDVGRAPAAAFGPPWANGRNAWLVGIAVSAIVPAGMIVTAVLWWVQGRSALRAGQPVPPPFWAGQPAYPPYPYGYPAPPAYPPAPQQRPDARTEEPPTA